MIFLKYADAGRDPKFFLWENSETPLVLEHQDNEKKVYSYGIYELTYSGIFTDPDNVYIYEVSYSNTETGQGMSVTGLNFEDGAWPWAALSVYKFSPAYITGGLVGEEIDGFLGNDQIYGRAGDDTIDGSWGSDQIYGGSGDDRLLGGPQNDVLKGGGGEDIFVFESNNDMPYYKRGGHSVPKPDVIVDFRKGKDLIEIDMGVDVKWIGDKHFRKDAHQIRYEFDRNDEWRPITEIQVQLEGNWKPEFTLVLEGRHHLTAADFIL